jgi:predicted RNase H-like HicB family nuclease
MIHEYLQAAMAKAVFKRIENPEPVFGEIPPCPGVWATGNTIEDCRRELEEVLEGWILLGIRFGDPFPEIDGLRVDIPETVPARE